VSETTTVALLVLLAALVAGWIVPAIGMRMFMPTLEASATKVGNYRGAQVSAGLGLVWLVWGVAVLASAFVALLLNNSGVAPGTGMLGWWLWWMVPALLVLVSFTFGLVDDVFGGSSARGFRGHLAALVRGRLTTGGLKIIGIGIAAGLAAVFGRLDSAPLEGAFEWTWIASWALATVTIALAANLVNLTDLRPGRALKTYCLLIAVCVPGLAFAAAARQSEAGALEGWTPMGVSLLLALGPVVAVWRYDLGERGMLGDAGANAMGALAGFLIVVYLPLWGLATAAAVLLALNVASERISFSKVIEGNRFLRWIDGLGRLDVENGRQTDEGAAPPDGNA
jgi:hypothetical protein